MKSGNDQAMARRDGIFVVDGERNFVLGQWCFWWLAERAV